MIYGLILLSPSQAGWPWVLLSLLPRIVRTALAWVPTRVLLCVSLSVDGLASLQRDPPEAWVRVTPLEGTSKRGSLERVACFKPLKEQSVLS
jgi:hypothetical protein